MSSTKGIVLCFALVGVLVLVDIGLRMHQFKVNAFTQLFGVVNIRTNDANAIVIVDRETGRPLWGKWNFGSMGKPETVSYFFEGKNVMNFYPRQGEPARFDIAFFGEDGKVQAVWINRGTNAGFTERVRYDVGVPRKEVWFNESWHFAQYHTNEGKTQLGIVLDGKWRHLEFTNGAATIEP